MAPLLPQKREAFSPLRTRRYAMSESKPGTRVIYRQRRGWAARPRGRVLIAPRLNEDRARSARERVLRATTVPIRKDRVFRPMRT